MKRVWVLGLLVLAMSPMNGRADAVLDCLDAWDYYQACHAEMTNGDPIISCEKQEKGGFGIFISAPPNSGSGNYPSVFIDVGPDSCGVGIGISLAGVPDRCAAPNNRDDIPLTKKQRAQLKKELKAICADLLQ